MFKFYSVGASDIGSHRAVNEDRILLQPQTALWALADGMGGYTAGDVASQTIVDQLKTLPSLVDEPDLTTGVLILEKKLQDINQAIRNYAAESRLMTVGSTVILTTFIGKVGVCMWLGDSRLYRIRGGQISQLSKDHSMVQELVDCGEISKEEAGKHPSRNVITRALGAETTVCPDLQLFLPIENDIYILCSDGLYHTIPPEEWPEIFLSQTLEHAVSKIIALALSQGADDNLSLVAIKVSS